MKKLAVLLLGLVVVLVAKHLVSHKSPQNTLLLYNIEALAADEINVPTRCFGVGTVDCVKGNRKVEYVFGGYSLEEIY